MVIWKQNGYTNDGRRLGRENWWVWNWENDEYEVALRRVYKVRIFVWKEMDEGCKAWCTDRLRGGRVSLMNRTVRMNGVWVVWVHKKTAGVEN